MTASPAESPGAVLYAIHANRISLYNEVFERQYQAALVALRGTGLDLLTVMREEIRVSPGTLTIEQRAGLRGQQAALDMLIEEASATGPDSVGTPS